MRTTLTIDPDVAQRIRCRTAQTKPPLKRVVNDALRAGLWLPEKAAKAPYTVEPYARKFKAGIDPDKLNQILDDLDAEELARKIAL